MKKSIVTLLLIVLLWGLAFAKPKRPKRLHKNRINREWSYGSKKVRKSKVRKMFDPEQNLRYHFNKHKKDFPHDKNRHEHLESASSFLHFPPSGTQTKRAEDGDLLRYHRTSRTFGVMSKTGKIRTMFKASKRYWKRQRGNRIPTIPSY